MSPECLACYENVQTFITPRNCTNKRKQIPTLKGSGPQGATLKIISKIPNLGIFFSVWSLNPHTEVVYIQVVSDVIHRIPALQWEETLATMWAGCFGSPLGSATSSGTLKSSWWDQMGSQWWGGTHRSKCQTSGLTFTNTCTTKNFWIRFQDAV